MSVRFTHRQTHIETFVCDVAKAFTRQHILPLNSSLSMSRYFCNYDITQHELRSADGTAEIRLHKYGNVELTVIVTMGQEMLRCNFRATSTVQGISGRAWEGFADGTNGGEPELQVRELANAT